MISSPKPPQPPDPKETAAAQAQMNKETAITQYGLNATNQVTPQGTLNYDQIGSWSDGTPRYQATTKLNEGEQAIYNQGLSNELKLGQVGGEQIDRVSQLLSQPVNLNNEATEARLMELGSKRLDPRFASERTRLEDDLFNRGVRPGSAAYNDAVQQFGQTKNDAYNQLLLTGRGQAVQEALSERNQPINEITALMSGSQVSQPNFVGTPSSSVNPVNYTGLVSDQYNAQLAGYNQQLASRNAMLGGLGSIAGTVLGGWGMWSDRRLKTDIKRIGTDWRGFGQYVYRYIWDRPGMRRLGVMADEVAAVLPSAVTHDADGFAMVDYGAL